MIKSSLKSLKKCIKLRNKIAYYEGFFTDLNMLPALTNNSELERSIKRLCGNILHDIWNLTTIIERLEDTRIRSINDSSYRDLWSKYAQLDIEHFHFEIRSIMDYLSLIINISSNKANQLPESYNGLTDFALKNSQKGIKLYGEEIHNLLIKFSKWFIFQRKIRDDIIHRGFECLVFGNPSEGILFMINNIKFKKSIDNDYLFFNEIVFNKNGVLSFEKYAVINISVVVYLLENISEILLRKFNYNSKTRKTRITSNGFKILLKWVKYFK